MKTSHLRRQRLGLRKTLLNLFLVIGGLVLVIVILEVVLRFHSPDWLKLRIQTLNVEGNQKYSGTDLGWPVEKRNGKFVKFIPGSSFKTAHYEFEHIARIDARGGREAQFCEEYTDEKFIPFLGDSFTFGVGVGDDETFVSLLGKRLNTCFLNLGVPGASLMAELKIIRMRHAELGFPSLYVVNFFLGNDFKLVKNLESRPLEEGKEAPLNLINDFSCHGHLAGRSYALQYIRAKLLNLYNSYRIHRGEVERVDPIFLWMIKNKPYLNEADATLRKELDDLGVLSEELGFKALFILIPDKHQVVQEYLRVKSRYYGIKIDDLEPLKPNELLKKRLFERNFSYIDPIDCLRSRGDSSNLYYSQDNHFTREGHEAMAVCVAPELKAFIAQFAE